jgi:hypothetical protein
LNKKGGRVGGGWGDINKSEKLGSLRKHTDKNKVKFSSYIRFRVEQLKSPI